MDHNSGSTELRVLYSDAAQAPINTSMVMALFVGSIFAIMLLALAAFSQSGARSIPENASAKSYGEGWECNIGFRSSGKLCVAVIVPKNAFETNRSYGAGWECMRGFREINGSTCVAIVVPEGGYLDPSGQRWRCLRGYIKVADTCQEIVFPANAYLTDLAYSSIWVCERGFEEIDNKCVAIQVPANAYLNESRNGRPWTCERGFLAQDGQCEAIMIPKNAYLDDARLGSVWKCERGYVASGERCELIKIPENAHLSRSGNRWEYDRNFRVSKQKCLLDN